MTEPDEESEGKPEAVECDLCGETFESEVALRRHVRSVGIVD